MPVPASADDLLLDLPSPMRTKAGTRTNHKLLEAIDEAFLAEWRQFFVDAVRERAVGTNTGSYLDAHRDWYLLPLAPDESDEKKRIRVGLRRARLWGGVTYDTLLRLCASILGVSPASIIVHESEDADTGDYAPMRITYSIDSGALLAAGVPPEDIASTLDLLSSDLSDAAGAGTLVIVRLVGGAEYDAQAYDADDAIYAS